MKSAIPIETTYPDIWGWLKKIGTLLSCHRLALLDGKTQFICILSSTVLGGRCQIAIAEMGVPPPHVQRALDDQNGK
jgi:hypothetical protein